MRRTAAIIFAIGISAIMAGAQPDPNPQFEVARAA